MKKSIFAAAALMMLFSAASFAADGTKSEKAQAIKDNLESHVQVHGFIRNYFAYDSRESVSGTGDLFYYLPKDQSLNAEGEDLNAQSQFRFLALTSRLWVDVNGYQIQNTKIGAKIEADFYNGLSGTTGTANFRLRQAYVTLGWQQSDAMKETLKIGQAWHPMAADMPDIFSLNTGAPFGPFSRTPVVQYDMNVTPLFGFTAAAIWQQQYPSTGPAGKSANYIKYGCTPELYLGANFTAGGFLGRLGVDMLSIKPRTTGTNSKGETVKVNDRITTGTLFAYAQYTTKFGDQPFAVKAKTVLAQGGEHVNLNAGYGVTGIDTDTGAWEYAATRNSSTWMTVSFGKKFQGVLFAGYVKNFGTAKDKELLDPTTSFYFSGNSFKNMTQMWRLTPTFIYNLGKLAVGIEYEVTSVQYGDYDITSDGYKHGLATANQRWITNNRLQGMVKFTF